MKVVVTFLDEIDNDAIAKEYFRELDNIGPANLRDSSWGKIDISAGQIEEITGEHTRRLIESSWRRS